MSIEFCMCGLDNVNKPVYPDKPGPIAIGMGVNDSLGIYHPWCWHELADYMKRNFAGKRITIGNKYYDFGEVEHITCPRCKKPLSTPVKENKNMSEINKFRNIIKECISEIKKEKDPRFYLKESLRKVVKNVLKEISNVSVPELNEKEKKTILKGYNKDGNERLDKTNEKMQKEIETIVHGIDPTWEAYWDDHNQLIVRAQNLLYVRIVPKYENNYDIDAMVKLVDRIRAIAQTWEQVKSFIKANFGALKNKTIPDNLHQKSIDNYKDKEVIKKSAGPDHDIIKNRLPDPEHAKIKDTKKDDKDYNEPQTKRDEDMPDQPMKQVTDPGKDPEGKNKNIEKTDRVKPTKYKNDKKLKVSDKKTPKFTPKKSS